MQWCSLWQRHAWKATIAIYQQKYYSQTYPKEELGGCRSSISSAGCAVGTRWQERRALALKPCKHDKMSGKPPSEHITIWTISSPTMLCDQQRVTPGRAVSKVPLSGAEENCCWRALFFSRFSFLTCRTFWNSFVVSLSRSRKLSTTVCEWLLLCLLVAREAADRF